MNVLWHARNRTAKCEIVGRTDSLKEAQCWWCNQWTANCVRVAWRSSVERETKECTSYWRCNWSIYCIAFCREHGLILFTAKRHCLEKLIYGEFDELWVRFVLEVRMRLNVASSYVATRWCDALVTSVCDGERCLTAFLLRFIASVVDEFNMSIGWMTEGKL
jgi:hypothetical protein